MDNENKLMDNMYTTLEYLAMHGVPARNQVVHGLLINGVEFGVMRMTGPFPEPVCEYVIRGCRLCQNQPDPGPFVVENSAIAVLYNIFERCCKDSQRWVPS